MFTKEDIGCFAQGKKHGENFVRSAVAGIMVNKGVGSEELYDRLVSREFYNDNDVISAIDILNNEACVNGVYFEIEEGDLVLKAED